MKAEFWFAYINIGVVTNQAHTIYERRLSDIWFQINEGQA